MSAVSELYRALRRTVLSELLIEIDVDESVVADVERLLDGIATQPDETIEDYVSRVTNVLDVFVKQKEYCNEVIDTYHNVWRRSADANMKLIMKELYERYVNRSGSDDERDGLREEWDDEFAA